MSPDPSHRPEESRVSYDGNYTTADVNNSENDDDISYAGYEILPQDYNENTVEPDVDLQDSTSEDDNSVNDPVEQSNFHQAVKIELSELWNSYNIRGTDIAMDSSKEEIIKNAMADFNLPPASIPLWAKDIPEEEWKQQILNRIKSTHKI